MWAKSKVMDEITGEVPSSECCGVGSAEMQKEEANRRRSEIARKELRGRILVIRHLGWRVVRCANGKSHCRRFGGNIEIRPGLALA